MIKNSFRRPRFHKPVLGIVVVVVLLLAGLLGYKLTAGTVGVKGSSLGDSVTSQKIDINKNYAFQLKDDGGNAVGDLGLSIQNAEQTNVVTVKGEKITAPAGSMFLILALEWDNKSNVSASVNSANFFRYIGDDQKLYAPTFYNTDVSIFPISVNTDKVGFAVPQQDKDIRLQVGEITGPKDTLELKFQ